MPPFCDVLVVHCGGNDLGRNKTPDDIADSYIDRFKDKARVVVFCSVVRRLESSPRVHPDFKHLSQQFNTRLHLRTTHFSNLHYYFHDPRLQARINIHSDGVHLSHRGLHRFYHSINRSIKFALRHHHQLLPLPSSLRTTDH